jgi:oligopeptide/dipeptide ABC transporter ATP-binding protein
VAPASRPNAPILEVRNLTTALDLKVGRFMAVDDVSFELMAGETLGIVGESGSGKSMTALSILRLLPRPVASIVGGQVILDGEDLVTKTDAEMRRIRGREIGMILQDPHTSLNPVFTIGNQLREALHIQDPNASRKSLAARAIAALKAVRVAAPEHRVKSYPHQMSGGMKQRVVGAIAISGRPKVIIADEPTTALDVTIQLQYLKLLEELQAETGMGILFITHDFGIVARLCHRIVVMYGGRIVESGPTEVVFDHPSHPYTEALLASVPTVERKVERLYAIEGQPPSLTSFGAGCRFAPRCPHAMPRCRTEVPPSFPGKSGQGPAVHTAACWLLEPERQPEMQPAPQPESGAGR